MTGQAASEEDQRKIKKIALSRKKRHRDLYILIACFIYTFFFCSPATASWLIDTKQFHVSVHGQNSCADCHERSGDRKTHPDAQHVTRNLADFFEADQCLSCHDDIIDNLEEGFHGSEKVKRPKAYDNCLNCHDPHYQVLKDKGRLIQYDPEKPLDKQCGACHEERAALPPFPQADQSCLSCHRIDGIEEENSKVKIEEFCFYCHAQTGTVQQEKTAKEVSLINQKDYHSTSHSEINCLVCHPQSAEFNHDAQKPGDCAQCHLPHDEKLIHDAHYLVSCEACHLEGVRPVRSSKSKRIAWKREYTEDKPSRIHHMALEGGEASCVKCHSKGNTIGAVSIVLPPKSILCMPCHAATFSIGDTTTIIALIVFLIGMGGLFSYWLTGAYSLESGAGFFKKTIRTLPKRLFQILKAMVLDVLLQRRLFRQSGARWVIHSLIFLPFAFRFTWGMIALIGPLWAPHWDDLWILLDKNHAVSAFLFDMTGIMVILGLALAFVRGLHRQSKRLPGLPGQDYLALALIAAIVFVGFLLEGMRIAMTDGPPGSEYAFIGHAIGSVFSRPEGLTNIYGYFWYVHAILAGAFIAYLPFSRLIHIIMAPLVLAMNAASEHDYK